MEAIKLKMSPLSLRRLCALLCVPRSSLFYSQKPEKPENLKMMSLVDTHLISHSVEGVLLVVDWIQELGYPIGSNRLRRMFKLMGRGTIYRRQNFTRGALKQFIKPYLLIGLRIERANQVWCTDITDIPMAHEFMYMTIYIDVYSRKIMGWGIQQLHEQAMVYGCT